jgi:hypothetical protein
VFDVQRQSQTVPGSIKEKDFHGAFKAWKKWWDHKTILKEMAAKSE